MRHFHLTVGRFYFAIAALIAAFLIQRPLINSQWAPRTALHAGIADLLLLIVLVAGHRAVKRFARKESFLANASRVLHYLAGILILIVVVSSQILFVKTGEILDFAIIEFGVRHFSALSEVASGEMNWQGIQPILFAGLFVAFAGLNLSRATKTLARAALVLPILLLPTCEVGDSFMRADAAEMSDSVRSDSLYQGAYANLTMRQMAWNASARDGWSMGILSGMSFGSAFGKLEYDAYSLKAGSEAIYEAPKVVGTSASRAPNVLMILLESVRYDAVGAYGAKQGASESATPFIDRFARESRVVERAYTTIPHTSKALVGIYCGTFPRFHPDIIEGLPGGLDIPCLPHLLAEAGYRSAHFQTAPASFENRDQLLRNMGFDHFTTQESFAGEPWERLAYLGMDDRAMIQPAVRWMQQQQRAGRPFFASLLTVTTHHPYVTPGSVKPVGSPAEAHQAYLAALRYTDKVVEELFAVLGRNGLLDNTLVIITGDHGEGFAEHGAIAHNGTAYEEGMRVPLIIREPKSASTEPIRGLRQHTDLMPTILEAAGISVSGRLPGRSLLSAAEGHPEVVTSCFYDNYCLTYQDDSGKKLIYFYGRRGVESYDLTADAQEQHNLYVPGAPAEAKVGEQMLSAVRLRNSYGLVWN